MCRLNFLELHAATDHRFRKSHVSLPTSAVSAPSLAYCGDVALSHLDGFAQRMLLSERIIKNASLGKVWPASTTILTWVPTTRCVLTSFVLWSKVVLSRFLLDSKCESRLFCVYKKNLSLRIILDARRSNQHCRVPPKFPMATGESFSHMESRWSEAPALHIASGDVQNAFHHMGISRMVSTMFLLETCVSSRFRHDG